MSRSSSWNESTAALHRHKKKAHRAGRADEIGRTGIAKLMFVNLG
jgi:hypothetical protein